MSRQAGSWLVIGVGFIVGVLFVLYVAMGRNYFQALLPLAYAWMMLVFLCERPLRIVNLLIVGVFLALSVAMVHSQSHMPSRLFVVWVVLCHLYDRFARRKG